MSDDLVKMCRRLSKYAHAQLSATDLERIADRIEELEAKLAKAISTLQYIADTLALHSAKETLAELKREK